MSESKTLDLNTPAAESAAEGGIGTALTSRVVTTPDDLLRAIARQGRMPMVRIGEALVSLGMITPEQLTEALSRQQLDRRVPVGELLVNSGAVSRADLQVALTRKMGYPLVDVDAFPVDPEALRKLGYATAQRLQIMPLMLHDGRLVIAMDNPTNRHSAIDEAEFSAQMKIVPCSRWSSRRATPRNCSSRWSRKAPRTGATRTRPSSSPTTRWCA